MIGEIETLDDIDLDDLDLEAEESFDDYDDWDGDESEEAEGSIVSMTPRFARRIIRRGRRRPPLRWHRRPGGVTGATLRTPRGSATLRLPKAVPTLGQFKSLETAVNRNVSRLNSTSKDMESLKKRVSGVVGKVATDLEKSRKEQQSQATVSMIMSMMFNRQLQDQLKAHTHPNNNLPAEGIQKSDDMMLILLPLMMSGTEDSSNNNMMMMMMMVMMMQKGSDG